MLNGGDKPVVGFTTNVGTSRAGAFHGGNEMGIARSSHRRASRERRRELTAERLAADNRPRRNKATR